MIARVAVNCGGVSPSDSLREPAPSSEGACMRSAGEGVLFRGNGELRRGLWGLTAQKTAWKRVSGDGVSPSDSLREPAPSSEGACMRSAGEGVLFCGNGELRRGLWGLTAQRTAWKRVSGGRGLSLRLASRASSLIRGSLYEVGRVEGGSCRLKVAPGERLMVGCLRSKARSGPAAVRAEG